MTIHIDPSAKKTSVGYTQTSSEAPIKVWDIPVRIFHWSLVILFIVAYVTNALGTNYFKYHLWAGYSIIVLVSFRILWGIVGTYHARFINFVRGPITTFKYAIRFIKKSEEHHLGHNPLGAIMVVALLLSILVQGVTGLFSNDEIFNLGPLYSYISNDLSLTLTSIHRKLFYWILGAIALHIIGVLFHVFIKRENIIKAMFTGKKPSESLPKEDSIASSKIGLAIILLLVISAALGYIVIHAPEIVTDAGY